MKKLSTCPVCFYEDEPSKFVNRKYTGIYEIIFFECPSCKKRLALKFIYAYALIGILALCFILSMFFIDVSLSATFFPFGAIFFCILILKKKGYLSFLDKVVFVEKKLKK